MIIAFTKDWNDVPTCTTHVLREMAKTIPVLWVNSVGTRKPSLGHSGDALRVLRRIAGLFRRAEHKENNLRVLSPVLVPGARSSVARWINRRLFAWYLAREKSWLGAGSAEYWCFVPNAVDLLPPKAGERSEVRDQRSAGTADYGPRTGTTQHPDNSTTQDSDNLPGTKDEEPRTLLAFSAPCAMRQAPCDSSPGKIIYYCVDDWSGFKNIDTAWIVEKERQMIARADIVFTPSKFLAEKCKETYRSAGVWEYRSKDPMREEASGRSRTLQYPVTPIPRYSPVLHVPHGVEYAKFRSALDDGTSIPDDIAGLPKPVVGFYGNIYAWIDFELIRRLAIARPAWSFVMIGQAYCSTETLVGIRNVHLLGRREHDQLPSYCKGFTAAFIPYDMSDPRMRSVNPVKLMELLAAGVPVACADLPELRGQPYNKESTADEPSDAEAMEGGRRLTQMDVAVCRTTEEWLEALDCQVARTDRTAISNRAAGNDWSERVADMRRVVAGCEKSQRAEVRSRRSEADKNCSRPPQRPVGNPGSADPGYSTRDGEKGVKRLALP